MWDRLRTLIRLGELASEPPDDRIDGIVGCNCGDAGDCWTLPYGADVIDSAAMAVAWLPLWGYCAGFEEE